MKRIITLLAACLLGLGQAYAQDILFSTPDSKDAENYFKDFPDRRWLSEVKLTIRTSDYFEFGRFPEYKVRLDYFLCEALTNKVLSIETKTVSVAANDFTAHEIVLRAPAGKLIRDDIHYDFQTKYNGKFVTCFGGYNGRNAFRPMYWKTGEMYVQQSEIEHFYFDNVPGEAFKKLNDPKLPAKGFFYSTASGWTLVYNNSKKDLAKYMDHYTNPDGVDRPSMKDGFWLEKVDQADLKHTMTFRLKYEDGTTPLPSNLKLYLFMESPLYDRNGNLRRIADCIHGGIALELSSSSKSPWIQGTFEMDNDERLFAYPVWEVVAKDLNTGKCHAVDWGLLEMYPMSSEQIYDIKVVGTIKNGDLLQSIKNGDLKVDKEGE